MRKIGLSGNMGFRRDQRAVCSAPRAARRPIPFDDARSTPQIRALVTSEHPRSAASAAGFRLWFGSGSFLFGFDALVTSLRLCSTFPAAEPQTEA